MDIRSSLLEAVLYIPAILVAFTVHSFTQAAVADRLGDKNPRAQGRLTLNPLAHVDLMGFLMILIIHFGWGKPVETNPKAYKNYYKDDLKVRVSGIIANLLTAVFFTIIFGISNKIFMSYFQTSIIIAEMGLILLKVFYYVVSVNCMFAIINIIPVPGLDGFHIMRDLNPKFFYSVEASFYKYQMIILIVFITLGSYIIGIPSNALTYFLISLVS
ncbi:MAG: site-2 protease family protein [Clostridiaceae bacterium]|nr:site-2 protease family protein [Clostridiaceae bacterium]